MFPAWLSGLWLCSGPRSIDESSRWGRTHLFAMVHLLRCIARRAAETVRAAEMQVAETGTAEIGAAGTEVAEALAAVQPGQGVAFRKIPATRFQRWLVKMDFHCRRNPQKQAPRPAPAALSGIATRTHPENRGFFFCSRWIFPRFDLMLKGT